jgi:Fur family peroxide stress response transcriptional regulator
LQPAAARRSTKQRDLIYEIVHASHAHPSAEEVYRLARRKLRSLSLGTVYRNLRLLADEGKIREVQFDGGPSRFDGMTEAHEHFVCTKCGFIADLPLTLKNKDLIAARKSPNVAEIREYRLDYYGVCKGCK